MVNSYGQKPMEKPWIITHGDFMEFFCKGWGQPPRHIPRTSSFLDKSPQENCNGGHSPLPMSNLRMNVYLSKLKWTVVGKSSQMYLSDVYVHLLLSVYNFCLFSLFCVCTYCSTSRMLYYLCVSSVYGYRT